MGRMAAVATVQQLAYSLWPVLLTLCKDPVWAVRKAAAAQIGPMLSYLPSRADQQIGQKPSIAEGAAGQQSMHQDEQASSTVDKNTMVVAQDDDDTAGQRPSLSAHQQHDKQQQQQQQEQQQQKLEQQQSQHAMVASTVSIEPSNGLAQIVAVDVRSASASTNQAAEAEAEATVPGAEEDTAQSLDSIAAGSTDSALHADQQGPESISTSATAPANGSTTSSASAAITQPDASPSSSTSDAVSHAANGSGAEEALVKQNNGSLPKLSFSNFGLGFRTGFQQLQQQLQEKVGRLFCVVTEHMHCCTLLMWKSHRQACQHIASALGVAQGGGFGLRPVTSNW